MGGILWLTCERRHPVSAFGEPHKGAGGPARVARHTSSRKSSFPARREPARGHESRPVLVVQIEDPCHQSEQCKNRLRLARQADPATQRVPGQSPRTRMGCHLTTANSLLNPPLAILSIPISKVSDIFQNINLEKRSAAPGKGIIARRVSRDEGPSPLSPPRERAGSEGRASLEWKVERRPS
jgi:hypothetical protein